MKTTKANIKSVVAFLCSLLFLTVLILKPLSAMGQYILLIGEKKIDLVLGEKQTVVLTNGQKLTLLLSKKDFLTFESRYFSFRHQSELTPSKSKVDEGVHQTLITTALGTCVIVQEYSSMDPSSLIDTMVQTLTKEEIRAGYTKEEKNIEKQLANGKVLKGKIVTTTHKDDQWIRSVLACGNGDEGVLVVTMIEKSNAATEQRMLDLFWESLALKGI